jgi:carbamoyltransferase
MAYNILAINPGHNGSAALVSDGQVIFYAEEERFSRMKYDGNPFRAMLQILINNTVDELVIGGTTPQLSQLPWTGEDAYSALVRKFNPNVKITIMGHLHHLGHAAAAFYNSGFETAAAVIVDGSGTYNQEQMGEGGPMTAGFETESIYQCGYPHEFNAVYKRYSDGNSQTPYYDNGIQEFDNTVTITKAYEAVSDYLGFGFIEAGKTMGLAPYGEADDSIPDFFVEGKGNKNLLLPLYPMGARIDENRFPQLRRFVDPREWHNDFSLVRDVDKNIAYKVQKETEEQMINLIQKALDTTGETNVVISGGYGLNCVANYKYIKRFPDVKFYIDPIAHDGGTAIGLARYAWFNYSSEITANPLKTIYLSTLPDYGQLDIVQQNNPAVNVADTTVDEIVDLIDSGNIVALFQGSAEAGPRALGNRSILFDPRRPDGKDFVNRVKKREWFRPFAGSVLEEHANKWFDMATLTSSPYMMYAVDVRPEKVDQIPAVTHVDNTCRVQTVNAEDNKNYYDLIAAFYAKTGVPVLFNTSFNLAGQPLVESIIDALVTLFNSDIEYLYLPDIGKLVTKNKQ